MKKVNLFMVFVAMFTLRSLMAYGYGDTSHLSIDHCYHWLDEDGGRGYLTFKYDYAQKNRGELTFYTTPGTSKGSVAGPGLYCAMTPYGSYNYGDRVIRIDFVNDLVILDGTTGRQHCNSGYRSRISQSECDKKPWDIKYYSGGPGSNYTWYVIRNPNAIANWSANSRTLVNDLKTNPNYGKDYSFTQHIDGTVTRINTELRIMGQRIVSNYNARASIVDTIKERPQDLRKIPALDILDRLELVTEAELDKELLEKTISDTLDRALADRYLSFSDLKKSVTKNERYLGIYSKKLLELASSEKVSDYAAVIFLSNEFIDGFSIENEKVLSLLDAIFADYKQLGRFSEMTVSKDSFGFNNFRSYLSKQIADINSIDPANYHAYIKMINKVVTDQNEIKRLNGIFINKLAADTKERMEKDGAQVGLTVTLLDDTEFTLYGTPDEIENQCYVYDSMSNFAAETSINLSAGDRDYGDFEGLSNSTAACALMRRMGEVVFDLNEYYKQNGHLPQNVIQAKIGLYEFKSYAQNRSQFIAQCLEEYDKGDDDRPMSVEVSINASTIRKGATGELYDKEKACGTLVELMDRDLPKTKDKKEKYFYARGYLTKKGYYSRPDVHFHYIVKKSNDFKKKCRQTYYDQIGKDVEIKYMNVLVFGHNGVEINVDGKYGLQGPDVCDTFTKYARQYFRFKKQKE